MRIVLGRAPTLQRAPPVLSEAKVSFSVRGCVLPPSLFYSDASADGVEKRSLVVALRSRSHARLKRNATFSCVQLTFIHL
ncbi:hypothetical protein EVAR_43107_1 [Eumeta japonica]|uniref:Uncharacterized protein n=1 Tax=Eumeta variegata TaxID=151549 RepID=A0A4C1YJ12_EUMVA|nr:hypothetical protein EVAR_43107_1 [Eumeta japonica]